MIFKKSFGSWCISIDNGYIVNYQYDVNNDIITIIKQLEEENEKLRKKLEVIKSLIEEK